VLHPFCPLTVSTTFSLWYLLKALEAELNFTAMITYCAPYATKSFCMHQNTSTSSPVLFLLRHPTLSLVYVAATHKTDCSTGNLMQASNINYASLYTRHSTNQVAHAELQSTFLVISSSNAHVYAKMAFTIWFVAHLML
jgi:hypothetical protein